MATAMPRIRGTTPAVRVATADVTLAQGTDRLAGRHPLSRPFGACASGASSPWNQSRLGHVLQTTSRAPMGETLRAPQIRHGARDLSSMLILRK